MSRIRLSRLIPARTQTIEFDWCKREFLAMSQVYRNSRRNMKPLDSCFWCGHKFEDGEMMALAHPKRGGANKVLCQQCADEMEDTNG